MQMAWIKLISFWTLDLITPHRELVSNFIVYLLSHRGKRSMILCIVENFDLDSFACPYTLPFKTEYIFITDLETDKFWSLFSSNVSGNKN